MTGTVWSYGPEFLTDSTATAAGGSGVPKTYIFSRAAGVVVTLPAATGTGHTYRFIVGVTVTSNALAINTASDDDEFRGVVYQTDTDSSDALVAYPAIAADNFDSISMNGTTTGGLTGDWIEVCDVASGVWAVVGHTNANGTVSSPIS